MTTTVDGTTRGRRAWLGLAVLALPCILYSMDLTVLDLAVPSLSVDLKPTSIQLLWILDVYGFVLAGSLMTMGTLGDRIGRRRLLMIGAGAFSAGSVLAAFSTSAAMLIATRALLGLAGATLAPSTLSLIRNMFPDSRERTVAIGVWLSSYSVGSAIGPLVGGVLLERFWWGSVFLLSVPAMALLMIVGPLLLPEFTNPDAGRVDLPSAALSFAAILPAIYGLKQIAQGGLRWSPVTWIAAGVGAGVVFVRRQRRLRDPLIDLRLFRVPAFCVSFATYTLATFVAFGIYTFTVQYLQLVLGLSPLRAGLWTMPLGVAFIVGTTLTPPIARRIRPAFLIAGGMTLAAAGFGALTQLGGPSALRIAASALVIYALGLAPVVTLVTDLILGSAPPERAGVVSALSETGSELGGALGVALLGSLGTAVYRAAMANAIPNGIPPESAAAASDTLGAALAVARQLPGPLGAELVGVARAAFTQALEWMATISAAIALATAVAAALLLRRVRSGAGGTREQDEEAA